MWLVWNKEDKDKTVGNEQLLISLIPVSASEVHDQNRRATLQADLKRTPASLNNLEFESGD
jgi:hypothetical protein